MQPERKIRMITSCYEEALDRIKWLEDGLKQISAQDGKLTRLHMQITAQATLDGEPTTADEYNESQELELSELIKDNPNDMALGSKVRSMIQSIGYRGED